MSTLNLSGLETRALTELTLQAAHAGISVNSLVLRLINKGLGLELTKPAGQRHADLEPLLAVGRAQDAVEFERATAPFHVVDGDRLVDPP